MKFRISKTLNFWVDVTCEERKRGAPRINERALIAKVLREFEEIGNAVRYMRADGKIGWKATPRMLQRLTNAERDAKDELDEWE